MKVEITGVARAMKGNLLTIDQGGDLPLVHLPVEDEDERWALYCEPVRITIEVVDVCACLASPDPHPETGSCPVRYRRPELSCNEQPK